MNQNEKMRDTSPLLRPLFLLRFAEYWRDCRKSPLDELCTFFMGHLTLPDLKIVDSGPFYEVVLCS